MMDGEILGKALKTAIDGIPNKEDHALLWEAVGKAIVQHISEKAIVEAGIPVATTGSASAQSGATTGPGKIT